MNYQEAIQFIYEKLPMYHKIGSQAYKPGLQNIEKLCEALGNPHKKFKSIHIAGTNGKGSTSHMISAMLQCSGFKTGLFTSPHLKNFTERIRVNGIEANKEFITRFIDQYQLLIEEIKPSFFEITTAMSFQYFAEQKVDFAVIEVGLGGRLDSTNIISPEVCVITNISFDHMDLLGNTLAEIAAEKAGIIKPNAPVIISESQPEIKDIFLNQASAKNTKIYFTDDIEIQDLGLQGDNRLVNIKVKDEHEFTNVKCGLQGIYQIKNIKGVVKTWQILNQQGFNIKQESLIKALLEVKSLTNLKGRWQTISQNPLIICDTGHNEGGIKEIVAQIDSLAYNNLIMIIGMVKEKDHDAILQLLPKKALYFFTQPHTERGLKAFDLGLKAEKHQLKGEVIDDVNKAIERAKEIASENDLIFVGGSTFVVSEIDNL